MSIKDYVSGLTYDQLVFAKQTIEGKISEHHESENVVLFVVSDTVCNVGCYAQDDWESAKAHLVQMIQDKEFTSDDIRDAPRITRLTVKEHEVEGWMSING